MYMDIEYNVNVTLYVCLLTPNPSRSDPDRSDSFVYTLQCTKN